MKKFKKIIALLLTMMMVFGMSATALAAPKESATITVKDQGADATAATLTYVQIIKADPTTQTGWAFTSDAVKAAFLNAFGTKVENVVTPLGDKVDNSDSENPVVLAEADQVAIAKLIKAEPVLMTNPENTAEDLAKLPDALAAADVVAATAAQIDTALSNVGNDQTIVFGSMEQVQTVTEAGVYAIKAQEAGYTYKTMAAYVGFDVVEVEGKVYEYPSLRDAVVITKKSPTEITKSVTEPNADNATQIDNTVTYTITAYVPFIDVNATDRTFKITDKIDGAAYAMTGETVYMAGDTTNYASKIDYTIEIPEEYDDAFEIDLSELVNETNSNANKLVTVTYQAKITEVDSTNYAASHVSGTEVDYKEIDLFTGKITLTKTDDNVNEEARVGLANAEFTLEDKAVPGTLLTFVEREPIGQEDADTRYYTYDKEAQDVYEGEGEEAVLVRTATTLITGSNGKLVVEGLDIGEYHFAETKAPKGYSINEDGIDAELAVDDEATAEVKEVAAAIYEAEASIMDTKLLALPSTGGIGTTIFTVMGCVIMIGAAGLFFVNRRKEA